MTSKRSRQVVATLRYFVAASIIGCTALAVAAPIGAGFPSVIDPVTGKLVYQLSATATGDNYALDANVGDWDGSRYLVYRNSVSGNPATIRYYRVDLESNSLSPSDTAITPVGTTTGGVVRGNYLYAFDRAGTSGDYTAVGRYDLATGTRTQMCALDAGWNAVGDVAVNIDATALIFVETWNGDRWSVKCDLVAGTRSLLTRNATIGNYRFSPTNSLAYTYTVDDFPKLSRIGVGRLDGGNEWLYTSDTFLNSFATFKNAYYAADGSLWTDALDSTQTSQRYAVRYTLGCDPAHVGKVCSYALVPIDGVEWQGKFATGPKSTWFIGDGSDASTLGEDYIHKIQLDPTTGDSNQTRLAGAVGTHGKVGANVHYLPQKNLVAWSAYRTLGGAASAQQNVFAVAYSLSAAFPSAVEASTGNTIYQLSNLPGKNNGFYYHDGNYDGGKYLVYRNIVSGVLTYYRVDLNSGQTVAVTPPGQTNGGFVKGNYLYTYYSPVYGGAMTKVSRFDLSAGAASRVDICDVDASWYAAGEIMPNADSSAVLFVEQYHYSGDPLPADHHSAIVRCNVATQQKTLLVLTQDNLQHVQTHPTDPNRYIYVNQSYYHVTDSLYRWGEGYADNTSHTNSGMTSTGSFLQSFDQFAHNLYAADGTVWADGLKLGGNYMVRLTLGCSGIGYVCSYQSVPIPADGWQLHYNLGPSLTWLVGDGDPSQYYGTLGIKKLHIDTAAGIYTQATIADGVGTNVGGCAEPNVHYLPNYDVVTWTACRTVGGVQASDDNIFAVDYN